MFPEASRRLLRTSIWALVPLLLSAAPPSADSISRLPPASTRKVDFVRDVQPILESSCIKCHARGKAKGGWRIDTRADALQPGDSGPALVAGNSAQSRLVHLVAGTDPDDVMPQKGTRLTPEAVGLLRAWIDQDLPWPDTVSFAKPPARNLVPRQPEIPGSPESNPIDILVDRYFKATGQTAPARVDDRLFARRVHLDTLGLLPSPAALEAFLKDRSPDKRTRLVRRLLGNNAQYAQHWLTFWNDLLRNDYRGTGYIDGGRKPISTWLYAALRDNKPYDQFVRELVDPTDASEGFTKGIVWRGEVNASMTPAMQAAQNIGQVLMGVNLKCASCHDSFIDDWQLSDAYGLAGIYANDRLQMVQCDKPTGKYAPLKFLFPELGEINAGAARPERLKRLAEIITSPQNGRLSRTIVNRLWARLMGRGLVEPLDVMQNPAWDPDLLDALAEDLVAHRWDLKRTLELILTSKAYQLPALSLPEKPEERFVFRGPGIRRLSAEQFRDAIGSITGVWQDRPEGGLEALLVNQDGARVLETDPFWIWSHPHGATGVPPGTNWFRKTLVLDALPKEGTLWIFADNSARAFVNGTRAKGTESGDWSQPSVLDLRPLLKAGTNIIAIEAINGGDGANPAGLLVYGKIRGSKAKPNAVRDIASDASWTVSTSPSGSWTDATPTGNWSKAQVLGGLDLAPWSVGPRVAQAVARAQTPDQVRASLTSADPLSLALGRPNREQVTTVRASTPTTIQALELTNGNTLSQLLQKGADQLLAKHPDGAGLTRWVFTQGLSRPPSKKELELAVSLVGRKPSREGVEDLLWSVTLLPEFQFTY